MTTPFQFKQAGSRGSAAAYLHPAAEAYQAAAYQRQAAQRLVAQLEDYGGAMLCDGVGLGKTYVATTVVVHYSNAWRERLAQEGRIAQRFAHGHQGPEHHAAAPECTAARYSSTEGVTSRMRRSSPRSERSRR